VQNKAAKFANHTKSSVWETLALRGKIARICAFFEEEKKGTGMES
jgi:hypothetical protein